MADFETRVCFIYIIKLTDILLIKQICRSILQHGDPLVHFVFALRLQKVTVRHQSVSSHHKILSYLHTSDDVISCAT